MNNGDVMVEEREFFGDEDVAQRVLRCGGRNRNCEF
jgi:hypothetical protein